eukprot:scaffold967_cov321-Pavlova_lutheri.AAC.23
MRKIAIIERTFPFPPPDRGRRRKETRKEPHINEGRTEHGDALNRVVLECIPQTEKSVHEVYTLSFLGFV